MIRPNKARKLELGSARIGPMRVVDTNTEMVFVVRDLLRTEKPTVHAQKLMLYPVGRSDEEPPNELTEQAEYLNASQGIIKGLRNVCTREGRREIFVSWERRPDMEVRTCEPSATLKKDVPGIVKTFLHTKQKESPKSKILDLFF